MSAEQNKTSQSNNETGDGDDGQINQAGMKIDNDQRERWERG